MQYISNTTDFKYEGTCVTLGKFDGVHLGHQKLLRELKRFEQSGLLSVMFTFAYYPETLFAGNDAKLIYTESERCRILEQNGPKVLLSYPFTAQTAAMAPKDFIEKVLIEQLGAKAVVVGNDFRFGKGREGDIALLEEYGERNGYELVVCEKVKLHDEIISSTLIRSLISEGKIERANEMLGRNYVISGTVAHGKQLGRTLSFPTANIIPPAGKLLPPDGVYFTRALVNGKSCAGLCNVGTNPTVNPHGENRTVENYFIGESFDVYGMELELELLHYHRTEHKFAGLDELRAQIARDVEAAKEFAQKRINQ